MALSREDASGQRGGLEPLLASAALTWSSGPWKALGLDPSMEANTSWNNRGVLLDAVSWYMNLVVIQLGLLLGAGRGSWTWNVFHAILLVMLRFSYLACYQAGEAAAKAASASIFGSIFGSAIPRDSWVLCIVAASNAGRTACLLLARAACQYATERSTCCKCSGVSSRHACSECRSS